MVGDREAFEPEPLGRARERGHLLGGMKPVNCQNYIVPPPARSLPAAAPHRQRLRGRARESSREGARLDAVWLLHIPDYYPELNGDFRAWYERLLREWELADELGYDAIWIAEHRYPGYAFSSTPVVAQALADRTKRIRIGTAIALITQRHPVLSAEHWAAVDLLSGGRLNFGIGRGISEYDFDTVGVRSEGVARALRLDVRDQLRRGALRARGSRKR